MVGLDSTSMTEPEDHELTSARIRELIEMRKISVGSNVQYLGNKKISNNLVSEDGKEKFIFDYNKGSVALKYTMQCRSGRSLLLMRLDMGGAHNNPTATNVYLDAEDLFHDIHKDCVGRVFTRGTPHIHMWRPGFRDTWAYPPPDDFPDCNDHMAVLKWFEKKCNISGQAIQIGMAYDRYGRD